MEAGIVLEMMNWESWNEKWERLVGRMNEGEQLTILEIKIC